MDSKLLSVFAVQVRFQAITVLVEYQRIRAILDHPNPLNDGLFGYGAAVETWGAVQNLLNAAGNIAKAFWPEGGRSVIDRADLRAKFETDDASPLATVRTMRNRFEHFDERIERWWAQSASQNYMDMVTGPGVTTQTADPLDAFRTMDTNTMEITFWGERFSLIPIVDEAQRLLTVLAASLRDDS